MNKMVYFNNIEIWGFKKEKNTDTTISNAIKYIRVQYCDGNSGASIGVVIFFSGTLTFQCF